MGRTRFRDEDPVARSFSYPGYGVIATYSDDSYRERCYDALGKSTDHDLFLDRSTWAGGEVHWEGFFTLDGVVGFAIPVRSVPFSSDISSFIGQFDAQRIAAATAPLKPAVYSLTNVLEFRDVPRMLRHAGDLLYFLTHGIPTGLNSLQMLASSILAYQFGWAPIMQDLFKCMDFAKAVSLRQHQIGELNSGKTLRRKIKLGSISGSDSDLGWIETSGGCFIPMDRTTVMSTKAWATIRWSLSDMNQLGVKPTWLESFNQLYGIPLGEIPIQLWKALPWSWMFDWFVNISNALEVSRNLMYYSPSRINLMWTSVYEGFVKPQEFGASRYKGMYQRKIELNRSVLSASDVTGLHLHVPFIDTYKLSVLSSLGILQILRGLR